jgi:tRNA (cmo5U34)-methyltransferase
MSRDKVFATPREQIEKFKFDDRVASVFGDMINRSVPGYGMMLDMIGVITRETVKPNTNCYDLGCSLGAATLSMRHNLPDDSCQLIGIDNSEAMVSRCQSIIDQDDATAPVDIRCEDILTCNIENASLVVMNLTLQFIDPAQREPLLERIYQGLNPGGILVLSEKTNMPNEHEQDTLTDYYYAFKRQQGYSNLENAQKREALDNVMIPDTLGTHRTRLHQAGFSHVTPWFQCFNFMSLLAHK